MTQINQKHWGQWEGEIIKVLVQHDSEFVNFKILKAKTGLTPVRLTMALSRLFKEKI